MEPLDGLFSLLSCLFLLNPCEFSFKDFTFCFHLTIFPWSLFPTPLTSLPFFSSYTTLQFFFLSYTVSPLTSFFFFFYQSPCTYVIVINIRFPFCSTICGHACNIMGDIKSVCCFVKCINFKRRLYLCQET